MLLVEYARDKSISLYQAFNGWRSDDYSIPRYFNGQDIADKLNTIGYFP
jgi:hypothetical protein